MTISQDRKLTYLNVDSGKPDKSFTPNIKLIENTKGNPFLNSLTTTPTGSIICASSSDKTVHLIDPSTGNSIFQGVGHGDLITDVALINHGSHIVSVSGDGCIFIWKVSESIRRKLQYTPVVLHSRPNSVTPEPAPSIAAQSPGSVFRFEESDLPVWARSTTPTEQAPIVLPQTQGRWAEVSNVDVACPK
jgi:WD40 repeat protein